MKDSQAIHAMLIDDSYKVEKVLANGACGLTELVTLEGEGPFVRKKIPHELARRRVWSVLAECDSPRLPCVEVSYELPDCFVVVYDFVPGESLQQMVEREGRVPCDQALLYVSQVCEAAQVLHDNQVIHRDITPGNIVVSGDGAHLVDFGIARIRTKDAVRDTASLGTWGFASPEQFGFAQSDARSDVYSLGRVLASIITGLRPDDEGYELALSDEGKVPRALKELIDKACAFEPSMRFQSTADFGHVLCELRKVRATAGVGSFLDADACGDEAFDEPAVGQGQQAFVQTGQSQGERSQSSRVQGNPAQSGTVRTDGFTDCEEASQVVGLSGQRPAAESVEQVAQDAAPVASSGPKLRRALPKKATLAAVVLAVLVLGGVLVGFQACGSSSVSWLGLGDSSSANLDSSQAESADQESAESDSAVSDAEGSGSTDSAQSASDSGQGAAKQDGATSSGQDTSGLVTFGDDAPTEQKSLLRIKEYGCSKPDDGYVRFVFAIEDFSEDYSVHLPAVRVTARNAKGKVLFSNEMVGSMVNCGQTIYLSSLAECKTAPSKLEFEFIDSSAVEFLKGQAASEYKTKAVSVLHDEFCASYFTGDVSSKGSAGSMDEDANDVSVVVVLRNEKGKIVDCQSGYVTKPSSGESASFDTGYDATKTKFKTYDVYASAW